MNERFENAGSGPDLLQRTHLACSAGDLAGARALASTLVDAARRDDDPELLGQGLEVLAQLERALGHAGAAIERYMESEALCDRLGQPLGVARALRHQADIHREQGLAELAESLYVDALATLRKEEATNATDLADALRGLALLYSLARRPELARPLWEEARAAYAEAGSRAGTDECELWLKP